MITFAFPDLLTWQAGIEYGLQALAEVRTHQVDFRFYLHLKGPMIEGVAFAVHQLQLDNQVVYRRNVDRVCQEANLILLPRVAPLSSELVLQCLRFDCQMILISDPTSLIAHPHLISFERRNWRVLSKLILNCLGNA